ncbi:hypothetical protein L204_101185 [Cryptococcus depauperatus]|nr:hypothetical protein L204_00882 [Cryptococcus depauperatus CBS 7855]
MPPRACQIPREELIACLLRTDCVLKEGKTPAECLKTPKELPIQCQHLIARLSDCKKGMLDMRRRFKGNHLSEEAKARARGDGKSYDEKLDASGPIPETSGEVGGKEY